VQLGFLNSENRDTHTARTFEIPATGALFILEDSMEHRTYFQDGEEVILFQSPDQIPSIIDWIRKNPGKSKEIARQGHLKVTNGANAWSDRAILVLSTLEMYFVSGNRPPIKGQYHEE